MSYLNKYSNPTSTPQSEPLNERQVKNNAGGYTYKLDNFDRLMRFLIIGTEGGSYYVGEKAMTFDNIKVVDECLKEDFKKTLELTADVSSKGRAPKNDQAIFVLARALSSDKVDVRQLAASKVGVVCRIPTHYFMLASMIKGQRGWGRSLRKAFSRYYEETDLKKLAVHMLKYRNREGWTHKDLIRKSHPKAGEGERAAMLRYVVREENVLPDGEIKDLVAAFEELNSSEITEKRAIELIKKFEFQREMVPTELQSKAKVQEVMLPNLGYTALMRNLANFTKSGLLTDQGKTTDEVVKALKDEDRIKKSLVHPVNVFLAAKTYGQGHGIRSGSSWSPVPKINRALDSAFRTSFGNIQFGDKRVLVALDVSGSMGWSTCHGLPVTPREVAAAVAVAFYGANPDNVSVIGFTGGANGVTKLAIEDHATVKSFADYTHGLPMGGTDCALPFIWAKAKKMDFDAVIVITDNETWAGDKHVDVAKAEFAKSVGHAVKLIVVGATATPFTIGDPNDPDVLNIAGFDGSIATLVTDFALGKLDTK